MIHPTKLLHAVRYLILVPAVSFILVCQGQQTRISGRVVDQAGEAIPFANVVLLHTRDTLNTLCGCATDRNGSYRLEAIPAGDYLLKASCIGYAPASCRLQAAGQELQRDLVLRADPTTLEAVVVRGKGSIRGIDRTTYTFDREQTARAREARELVASLPGLHIDRTANSLATVDGKSVLILINGVKATESELKLLPADRIRSVESYDIPPIRYLNDADRVVNVRTRTLDAGWSGDLYGTLGQLFSSASAAFSRIRGNDRFTFDYASHFNMKRELRDLEQGVYEYGTGQDDYRYDYLQKSRTWGDQHRMGLAYARSCEGRYDLRIAAAGTMTGQRLEADKEIVRTRNGLPEECTGRLTDRTRTLSPTVEAYYHRQLTDRSTLTLDLLGSRFRNEQRSRSTESGERGFDDAMLLDNRKHSLIGEIVYGHRFGQSNLTLGYRAHCNFLANELRNSLSAKPQEEYIDTRTHRLYGEFSGRTKRFLYRVSLGACCDLRTGREGFRNWTFTPVLLAGWQIGEAHNLRISYRSSTQMPEIQQMSEARILIMEGFYRSGNKTLRPAHLQSWGIDYSLMAGRFSMQASLFLDHTRNSLFDDYRSDGLNILQRSANAAKDLQRGGRLSIDFRPWDFLRIGGSVELARQSFRPSDTAEQYDGWSCPATLYLSAGGRRLTFDLYQKFGGSYLSGLYRCGIEKSSYVSLNYRRGNLAVGLQCFFPFIRDRYTNETTAASIVRHRTDHHLRRKDHTVALSLSWNFHSGHKAASMRQRIENADDDSGLFRIR